MRPHCSLLQLGLAVAQSGKRLEGIVIGNRMLKGLARHWQLYAIVSLPLAFLMTFNYIPMIGAQIAFRDFNPVQGMWNSTWVGMKYFNAFFQSPFFWPIIRNTLTISLYHLLVSAPAAIVLALAINEVKHQRFKKTVQMVTYIPYFISVVVLVGMMDILLSPTAGLWGQFASVLGIERPTNVLGNPSSFYSLYVWSAIWQETGYGAVIYLAALSGVNPELYEAARLDGASRIRKIFHIDLPAIKPTMVILFVLSLGSVLGVGFEKAYLLQRPTNLATSEIIATYVYKIGLVQANFSFSVAVGLFNSLVGLVLILLVNYAAKRLTDSSLF